MSAGWDGTYTNPASSPMFTEECSSSSPTPMPNPSTLSSQIAPAFSIPRLNSEQIAIISRYILSPLFQNLLLFLRRRIVVHLSLSLSLPLWGLPNMTSANISDFLPPPPCHCHKSAYCVPFVCFLGTPLSADGIYGSPLSQNSCQILCPPRSDCLSVLSICGSQRPR